MRSRAVCVVILGRLRPEVTTQIEDQVVILLEVAAVSTSPPKCLPINVSALSRCRSETPQASSSQPNTQLESTPSNPTFANAANTAS